MKINNSLRRIKMADIKLKQVKVINKETGEELGLYNLKIDLEDQVESNGKLEPALKLATEEQIRALFDPTSN